DLPASKYFFRSIRLRPGKRLAGWLRRMPPSPARTTTARSVLGSAGQKSYFETETSLSFGVASICRKDSTASHACLPPRGASSSSGSQSHRQRPHLAILLYPTEISSICLSAPKEHLASLPISKFDSSRFLDRDSVICSFSRRARRRLPSCAGCAQKMS